MASYLETYGEAEQHRAKRIRSVKWIVSVVVIAAVAGLILWSVFQNHSEEARVNLFLDHLKAQDYQDAYRMWGCTEATPCRDYSFTRFMDDWGPKSPHANAASAKAGGADTCGTGVVVPVDFNGTDQVPLWVEKSTKIIGFSPDPECRKKRLRIREFIHSLFK